jgi:hypothetical protein
VTAHEIGGTDHATILWADETVRRSVAFLDPLLGVARDDGADAGRVDPRLGTIGLYLLVALALVGMLGLAVGSLAPAAAAPSNPGGYALLAGALVVTMPLLGVAGLGILPIGAGGAIAMHLLLAAGVLWAARVFVQRGAVTGRVAAWIGTEPWLPLRQVALPGVAAGVAIFLLLAPIGGAFHRLGPTTERLVLWVVVVALSLPFFAAFEALVRRGSTWAAIGWGLLGRALLLVLMFVGVGAGVLPGVIALVVPLLVAQYVLLEIFAATCYATGRNPAVIAVVDSVFIAWVATTLTPIG